MRHPDGYELTGGFHGVTGTDYAGMTLSLIEASTLARTHPNTIPLWLDIIKQVASQWIALVAFFAFPAIQYLLLRVASRRKGQPELWYLPAYGFRLVIRNLPHRKILTDINYRTFARSYLRASDGSSVVTLMDEPISSGHEMVLFPQTDQILLSFQLCVNDEENSDPGESVIMILVTDKTGSEEVAAIELKANDLFICDYSAIIQNPLNFNVQIGKRVEIYGMKLYGILAEIQGNNIESRFSVSRIRNIY